LRNYDIACVLLSPTYPPSVRDATQC
jgi:hypothetical protein